jgi:YD repeat-containing protein
MKITRLICVLGIVLFQSCKDKTVDTEENTPAKTCLLIEESNGNNIRNKYSYDEKGRVTAIESSPNVITKYFYDSLNRVQKEEFWSNGKLGRMDIHFYNELFLTDSVFEYREPSNTYHFLYYVLEFNQIHLPIKRKYYMGNSYPVHEISFSFDKNENLMLSADTYPGHSDVHSYAYDNKKSPYPKVNNQYIPINLSNKNILEDYDYFVNNKDTLKYVSYQYIYNIHGYPLKKVALKYDGSGAISSTDTTTFLYICK